MEEVFNHRPVLLNEVLLSLDIKPDGVYVDATVGGAGHSLQIAKRLSSQGALFGIDQDPVAVKTAGERLKSFPNARVLQGNFSSMKALLKEQGIFKADGILLDLGVSSYQLDTPKRGFSYNYDAPLDMRMSCQGLSAFDVVNSYTLEELSRIIRDYSEERFSFKIAKEIVKRREISPIKTTLELADLIKEAIPAPARREGKNPAKRTFQAIRIEVNGELRILEDSLKDAFSLLNVGGRLSVISFHSLEDRIVKNTFGEFCQGCICPKEFPVCVCNRTPQGRLVSKKPITAQMQELEENKRSHSAKLRTIEKIKEE